MCTSTEKTIINNINRAVIGIACAAGTLIDGFHPGDLICVCSTFAWLLQPECNKLEEKLIDGFRARVGEAK